MDNNQNWYVIQIGSRQENTIAQLLRTYVPDDILLDVIVPKYVRMKRYEGAWHKVTEVLCPGYLFVQTDDITELYEQLKKIPKFTKVLGKSGNVFFPLYEDEIVHLLQYGGKDHILDMSSGYIEGDKVVITDGPLVNLEGSITKIDRHKRLACLDIPMANRTVSLEIGLEIISKI